MPFVCSLPGGKQKHLLPVDLNLSVLPETKPLPDLSRTPTRALDTRVEFEISPLYRAPCLERNDLFPDERSSPCSGGRNEEMGGQRGCTKPALLADARRTGVRGNSRVLAFQTQGEGWVKVQLIPFKEKNSSSLTFRGFDPDQSEATESSQCLESVFSSRGLELQRSRSEPVTCWA